MRRRLELMDFGGEGVPIVLLQSFMGRAHTCSSVPWWLKSYGHVLGVDARGHGRRPPEAASTTEVFVADIAAAIGELDGGPAVLIGHSVGGWYAWASATRHPELVRGILVEDMVPDQHDEPVDWADVGDVRCPLLMLEDEHAPMSPDQRAEPAKRIPEGGRYLRIAGSGGTVRDSRPDEYRGAVEAFLSELLGR